MTCLRSGLVPRACEPPAKCGNLRTKSSCVVVRVRVRARARVRVRLRERLRVGLRVGLRVWVRVGLA